ncbi:GNAT family N-acetyltransferase [Vibrio parahaemolyticus]|nr:GNAT family N-acetyltransferase [Vibrio parahaemolyticus]EJC7104870.1 GNAT family N-acetyltransferase [Vibrio parahaemolyticus]EJC7109403.1 GNAT family N-acetyltransferase [Vibrio parahaemolyticus]
MIDTERTRIEVMSKKHASSMLTYQLENREHLAPWSPLRTDEFYTLDNWLSQCEASESAFEKGSEVKFVALDKDTDEIVGVCSFTGIARGVFQACFLGYSIAKKFEAQGYMTEILQASISYMFDVVGLNRVMATYMPNNIASEKVLLKLGFEKEGLARKYLKIAGKWEDHTLTSKLNERT